MIYNVSFYITSISYQSNVGWVGEVPSKYSRPKGMVNKMKLSKKVLCCIMAAAMSATAFTACANNTATSGTSSAGGTSSTAGESSTGDQSSAGGADSSTADSTGGSEESSGGSSGGTVEAPSNGTVLNWCGYYDINVQDKDIVEKFQDEGYTVEYVATTSTEYFVKQGQLARYGKLRVDELPPRHTAEFVHAS